MTREKLSCDVELYNEKIHTIIRELWSTYDRVDDADQSDLFWRLLPEKIFIHTKKLVDAVEMKKKAVDEDVVQEVIAKEDDDNGNEGGEALVLRTITHNLQHSN